MFGWVILGCAAPRLPIGCCHHFRRRFGRQKPPRIEQRLSPQIAEFQTADRRACRVPAGNFWQPRETSGTSAAEPRRYHGCRSALAKTCAMALARSFNDLELSWNVDFNKFALGECRFEYRAKPKICCFGSTCLAQPRGLA